jgi:hypothetical protein
MLLLEHPEAAAGWYTTSFDVVSSVVGKWARAVLLRGHWGKRMGWAKDKTAGSDAFAAAARGGRYAFRYARERPYPSQNWPHSGQLEGEYPSENQQFTEGLPIVPTIKSQVLCQLS